MNFVRSRIHITKWNILFQYIAIALAFVSAVVLVPMYLRFIPLDLYGAWLATGNILAWLTVIDPGLSTVIQQRVSVAYGKGDMAELNSLLTGGVMLSGVVSLFVLVAGFASSKFLIRWLNLSIALDTVLLERAFLIAVIGSAFMIFSYGLTAFNIGMLASPGIGAVFVTSMIVSITLTVFLLYQGIGLLALPIGLVVSGVGLTAGNAGYLVWRYKSEKMDYHFSFQGVGTLAKLSAYTFLGRGAGIVAANMDAFVLARYLGAEIVPVFIFTRRVPDMSRMLIERPVVAFMPAISHLVGAGEIERARAVLVRLSRMVLWMVGLIAGGFFMFNSDFIALWVGPNLFAGRVINIFIVLTLVVSVLTNALSNLCFSLGNIRGNSFTSVAQGLLAVPLMILSAQYWGMLGIALAPLFSMLAVSAWYYPYAFSRLLKLERDDRLVIVREAAIVILATILALGALSWFTVTSWATFVFAVAAFSAIYLAVLACLSALFRGEMIDMLKNSWLTRILDR